MLSPSRSITPTLTSRKLTESSETLIPPLALHQDPPSIVFVWDPLYLLYLWALCWNHPYNRPNLYICSNMAYYSRYSRSKVGLEQSKKSYMWCVFHSKILFHHRSSSKITRSSRNDEFPLRPYNSINIHRKQAVNGPTKWRRLSTLFNSVNSSVSNRPALMNVLDNPDRSLFANFFISATVFLIIDSVVGL